MTGAFPAGTYDIVVNDGTRYWQNATSITIEETVLPGTGIEINVMSEDANYTFSVSKNVTLTANFLMLSSEVTWHNLLKRNRRRFA